MWDPREQLKGGFRAFAQRDAQRREDRDAVRAGSLHLAVGTATDTATDTAIDTAADPQLPPATADAPVYGPRLVKDTPDR